MSYDSDFKRITHTWVLSLNGKRTKVEAGNQAKGDDSDIDRGDSNAVVLKLFYSCPLNANF